MLKDLFKRKASEVEVERARVIAHLATLKPDSQEYVVAVSNLKTLEESRSYKNEKSIGAETWLTIGANLLGIGLVLFWEEARVVSKTALGMIIKSKL